MRFARETVDIMELVFLVEWQKIASELHGGVLDSLCNAGIKNLVLSSGAYDRELAEAGFMDKLFDRVHEYGMKFTAVHGLWSADNDLNWPDEKGRNKMVECQKRFICIAASAGCRTCTLHPGVAYMRYNRDLLWDNVRKSVDSLLPEAEKNNIILALENNVTMNLGIDCGELAEFITSFNNPFLGACFDSGHAHAVSNVLDSFDALSPHVVTAHLHDNDGTGDQHLMPYEGNLPWSELMAKLSAAPRLIHVESEPSGMHQIDRINKALDIYTKLVK